MDWIISFVKRLKLSRFDWVLLGLMVIGGVLILMGILGNVDDEKSEVEYLASDSSGSEEMIWIDVAGAVEKPGVYELSTGARIKDVLVVAGGLSKMAERDYLERVINMAEEVKDGQKIYIPRQGGDDGRVLGGSTDDMDGLININTASVGELDTLWGIGSARAQTIVDNRPFSSVKELLEKEVLSENVYERVKEKVSVY